MSVLVLSTDEEASRALCSALSRAGLVSSWSRSVGEAWRSVGAHPPMVLVADTDVSGVTDFINAIRAEQPWVRVYLMADPGGIIPRMTAPLVPKPFDAAQLAELLARELELAQVERGRRSLQAHADELALLVQASFEAIVGLGADGTVLSWNRGAETLYGYTAPEMIGRCIDIVEPGDALAERLRKGERHITEVIRRTKLGAEVVVHLSLSTVPTPRNTALRFAEVSLDVTARRKLVRELEHAERLATIGRLAASMAHEINNPLAVIRVSTEYIGQTARDIGDPQLGEAAEDMRLAAERISGFVQHLCGFARRERAELERAPISDTIALALRMVKPRALERGVELILGDVPALDLPHDPPRLAQAVVNVVANAVDAAALGGKHVNISVRSDESDILIDVDDDGLGLSEEIRSTVFEPFTTTKPHGQGTGLGLAITAQIISDHGGAIDLENLPGGGVRARIRLKALEHGASNVLVVDGDPSMRRVLASALRSAHFNVVTADTPEEAVRVSSANKISVVVCQQSTLSEAMERALHVAAPRTRVLRLAQTSASSQNLADSTQAVASALSALNREELAEAVGRLCAESDLASV